MSPALTRGLRKGVRTLLQLAVGGALTAAVNVLADGLAPNTKVLVLTGWTVAIALLQNVLETAGTIPALLPSPGLVTTTTGGALGTVVGTADLAVTATVEPAVEGAGELVDAATDLVADVVDTAGNTVGAVTGRVTGVLGK